MLIPDLRPLLTRHLPRIPKSLHPQIAILERQLIWAIHDKDVKRIRQALDTGACANVHDMYDSHFSSAVVLAALYKLDLDTIGLLLSHGANPNVTLSGGPMLIEWAAAQNNSDLVRLLLLHSASAEEQVIRTYLKGQLVPEAALGNTDQVKRLLKDPAMVLELEEALLYAVSQGHVDTVDLLLEQEIPTQKALEIVRAIRNRGLSGYIARRYYLIERMLTSLPEVQAAHEPALPTPSVLVDTSME